jgi:hypothetical protein
VPLAQVAYLEDRVACWRAGHKFMARNTSGTRTEN